MYSVRRDPNHSYYYSQYWTISCQQQQQQQQQQFIFNSRQTIKTKHQYIWSTKFYKDNSSLHYPLNTNSLRSTESANTQDLSLPVYRAPCTFQNSLLTSNKDGYPCGISHRSPLSSTSSSCVPDVYSPGSTSSGNCSPPPPTSNLPPPPSEWLE
ncbi:unnamed protein product [Adineta ricciae]|uniref:Uncharacterized protein n=1 Tax=Adineta ricciae TaxID=249248 RepID=A0A813VDA3_ADIRI|nr:unnamed protein product [Adineta ricciae]